jgi:predicted O-linked N-acetylglucosamine transferase (SPINDLY family)
MGLFDRFRTLVGGREIADENGEQNALGSIAEGNAHEDDGRLDEAMRCYEAAIRLAPYLARAHLNRGNVLLAMDDAEGALAAYATALALGPDSAAAHFNTGNTHRRIGRRDAAITSYRRAIELQPDFVDAELALGDVLKDLGRIDSAVICYYRVLELKPSSVVVCVHVGNMLREAGQFEGAAESYRQALQLEPDYAEVHCYLGNVLQKLGQFENAVISYRQALQIKPDLPEAHNNLGVVQKELGLPLNVAAASYRRALEIKPDFAEAHINLGTAFLDIGTVDDAVACYQRALEISPSLIEARSQLLFIHNYQVDAPANVLLAEAIRYGEFSVRDICPYTAWENQPDPSRCLRVGLVSGDFRQHPVGNFLESVLAALMTEADGTLAVLLYASHTRTDEITERMKLNCHGWRSVVGMSDETLARQVREDSIDILIDLSGHTPYNRLPMFALKAAPVQLSWLGYFATTGVPGIDYLIADKWTLPESEEVNFTEKIWRLPETRLCFTPPDVAMEVSPLPALSKGYVTFACCNNLPKMNDAVVALWARVLVAVPNSCLFLKAKQLDIDAVRQSTLERFVAHGIDPERLILEGPTRRAEYFSAYQRVDIALDPFPYTGGTTSVESLWMGVPVLTLAGKSFLSRQGVGLLMNAGLPEWIAEDHDDYVARAVSHAGDLQALSSLRSELRQRVLDSPIFDAPRFAQHFETALRGMWQKWCADNASSSVQHEAGVPPQETVCVPIVENMDDEMKRRYQLLQSTSLN